MAEEANPKQTADENATPVDPGGAHNKGYSADPGPAEAPEEPDPVPLAPGPNTHSKVRVPERDNRVQPTGRNDPPDAQIEI